MTVSITVDSQSTLDTTPVLTGTCSERNADVTVAVGVSAITGAPDDVYTTKAVGGQYAVATEPLVYPTQVTFASSKTADADRYVSESILVEMEDGNLLAIFRRGGDHVGNGDRILGSISTDHLTWGAEFLILDDASGYATRNVSGGIDPDTGRIWLFYQLYDYPAQRYGPHVIYSDDNAVTWSTGVNLISEFPSGKQTNREVVPFGPMVKTSNGLMQTFYWSGEAWALFYDGSTWTDRVDLYSGVTSTNEPVAVRVDDDRIVIIIRDDGNDDSYRYASSSNGGTTWTSVSAPYPYTSDNQLATAPLIASTFRGQVQAAITQRYPVFTMHTVRAALEDFWDRPWILWSEENPYRIEDVYAPVTSVSADYGYPSILGLTKYPDTSMVLFYDQDGANALDVSIYSKLLEAV